ncbi:serine/threonine protein kinase [Cryptosporangium japonicum]
MAERDDGSELLSRYRIIRLLRAGAEGRIYEGEYIGSEGSVRVPVAIKEYDRPANASPHWPHDGTWRHIEEQVDFLNGLPNNIHLVHTRRSFLAPPQIDLTKEAGRTVPYVVMEWIDGEPPDAILRRDRVPLVRRTTWVRHLAEALSILHDPTLQNNPLAHSDVKPGNCIISPTRGLVLVDMGSLHLARGSNSRQSVFTPDFAAPEVLQDPLSARSEATDLFSLAATAFSLITEEVPSLRSDADGYLDAAYQKLRRTTLLQTPIGHRPRRKLIDHLLKGMDPSAENRAAVNLTKWARRLDRLARRPRILRLWVSGTAVTTAAALILTATLSWFGMNPFLQSSAVDFERGVVHWDLLPDDAESATSAERYVGDFRRLRQGWAESGRGTAEVSPDANGLLFRVSSVGKYLVFPIPQPYGGNDERVIAVGRINSGQGGWGVWCRGAEKNGGARYQFVLTHAGNIGIFTFRNGEKDAVDGTAWWHVDGLDLSRPVTIEGRCSDSGIPGVSLTMLLNGRKVLSQSQPKTLLGPGYSGLSIYAFDDLSGPKINLSLSALRIY